LKKITEFLTPSSHLPRLILKLALGEQVFTLATGVAQSASSLDKTTTTICREELKSLGISSKVLSKLKAIGKTLL